MHIEAVRQARLDSAELLVTVLEPLAQAIAALEYRTIKKLTHLPTIRRTGRNASI